MALPFFSDDFLNCMKLLIQPALGRNPPGSLR